jgi:hypothetical protein
VTLTRHARRVRNETERSTFGAVILSQSFFSMSSYSTVGDDDCHRVFDRSELQLPTFLYYPQPLRMYVSFLRAARSRL